MEVSGLLTECRAQADILKGRYTQTQQATGSTMQWKGLDENMPLPERCVFCFVAAFSTVPQSNFGNFPLPTKTPTTDIVSGQ